MLIEERLEKLLKIVNDRGSITAKEAGSILKVSNDTIRRDFIRLSKMGLILRTHGGIISKKNTIYEYSTKPNGKIQNHYDNKVLIARQAVSLIQNGETIILDGGTTTFEIAKLLGNFQDLTVLTYGLNIAYETCKYDNVSTIIFGGMVSSKSMAVLGPDAAAMIRNYHGDKLFLAVNAMTIEKGLMTPNRMQADLKKELIKITNEVIVVADSSKINKTALFTFCSINDISQLITDAEADQEFLEEFKNRNIKVFIAK